MSAAGAKLQSRPDGKVAGGAIPADSHVHQGGNPSVAGALMGHAPGSKMADQYYTFITDEDKRRSRLSLREVTQVGLA